MNCVNHAADRPAVATARMSSAEPPYYRDVPLCAECAPRVETIGYDITPVET